MFVVVMFGEKEESIFNPHCKCVTLLANIREKCNYSDEVDLDLSDESGNVKNLRDTPYKYANEVLAERERLVLLRVDRQDGGEFEYTPLLQDNDFVNDSFLAQLASKAANIGRPQSRQRIRGSGTKRNAAPTNRSSSNKGDKEKGELGKVAKQQVSPHSSMSKMSKPAAAGRTKSRLK